MYDNYIPETVYANRKLEKYMSMMFQSPCIQIERLEGDLMKNIKKT